MILATDVHYAGEGAVAAGLIFPDWQSDAVSRTDAVQIDRVAPYRPGRFYERELPCLLVLLERFPEPLLAILVDGYVTLGAEAKPGLGAHLYAALDGTVPVIGVAKTRFGGTPKEAEVLRGQSRQPLYVTAVGIDPAEARNLVRRMHGAHRVPTLLAQVDRLGRAGL